MDNHPTGLKPESWLVSAGRASELGAPLNVPLTPASNFIIGRGREYSRDDGTPTWEALEEIVGGLELGKSVAFASGMAAIASVFDLLAAGAVVVLPVLKAAKTRISTPVCHLVVIAARVGRDSPALPACRASRCVRRRRAD